MKIKQDKKTGSIYIYICKGRIKETFKISERVSVDVDKNNNIVGIEILK